MDPPLAGRVALVTGGSRGIGRILALGLARAGADVAVMARTKLEVDSVAQEICELGRRSLAVRADVNSQAGGRRAVEECAHCLGPPDVLINAAAVQGPIGRFDTLQIGDWMEAVQTNLVGLAFITHAALRHMVPSRRGKIVNISGGGSASPRPRFSAYAASKAAVVRLTETLAEELHEVNIQVNAVGPGATRTQMTRQVIAAGSAAGPKSWAEAIEVWKTGGMAPEKQVALVTFLASGASDHVTGRFVHVNDPWEQLLDGSDLPCDLYKLRRVDLELLERAGQR